MKCLSIWLAAAARFAELAEYHGHILKFLASVTEFYGTGYWTCTNLYSIYMAEQEEPRNVPWLRLFKINNHCVLSTLQTCPTIQ